MTSFDPAKEHNNFFPARGGPGISPTPILTGFPPDPRTGFGCAVAGSLGVRGFVSEVYGSDDASRALAVQEAIEPLKREGVQRVHAIVTPGDPLEEAALAVGFRPCPGETLFERILEAAPPAPLLPDSYTLRRGTAEDLQRIKQDLVEVEELEFKEWEFPLIEGQLARSDRFLFVIEHGGDIVGIIVGGSYGERGTMSHIWVAKEHREHKLGHALSDSSLAALYEAGARIVHLMTTPGNVVAERFWERQGFTRQTFKYFVEMDI